jgi:putative lipoprotein
VPNRFWFIAILMMTMLGCGLDSEDKSEEALAQIEGTVFYRERIALPPNAVVQVQLEDVSRPDAPATVMAVVTLNSQQGPPYAFSIAYSPHQIDSRMTYALRATIRVDDKLRFINTEYINPFSGNPVEVLVRGVSAGG